MHGCSLCDMIGYGYKNSVEQCSVYLKGGIAKRLTHDKQSTPRHADISTPLVGGGYATSMKRFVTALSCVLVKLAISLKG